jgi:hypothetical protein
MPSTTRTATRPKVPQASYYYRRPLRATELLSAVGAGIGAGVVVFYIARLMLQQTPLVREPGIAQLDERGVMVRRPRPRLR